MLALASTASAKPGNGKGGGGGGGDKEDGGGIVPISVTFADEIDDRVGSDVMLPYVDGEYPRGDGTGGIEAFLGSKANSGNVWLRLAKSSRGLLLDFRHCVDGICLTPFEDLVGYTDGVVNLGVIANSAIKLDANDVLTDGVLSMKEGEPASSMPMRIFYDFDDGRGPGFIEFNPDANGGSPCKNKSDKVWVKRTSPASWDVWSALDNRACVILPGGGGRGTLSGIYEMKFSFTVEIQP